MLQIQHHVLQPQRCALADRGRLCRLEVRIRQRRQIGILLREIRQCRDGAQKQRPDAQERLPLQEHVRVVPDVAAGRAQMDDRPRVRADLAVGVDMRHDVMPHLALPRVRHVVVDVVHVRPQLGDLLHRNIQPQLALAFRQRDPQPPPGGKLAVVREDFLHLPARVAAAQGVFVNSVFLSHVSPRILRRAPPADVPARRGSRPARCPGRGGICPYPSCDWSRRPTDGRSPARSHRRAAARRRLCRTPA